MTANRLRAIELAYLALERRGYPIHVGSIAIFESGPLMDRRGHFRLEELRALIAGRLDQVPRLRQRVGHVPLDVGRPVWVDDVDFDIARHVDVVALPPPGDEQALLRLATELHMRPFEPEHPMWHLCFVTGLRGGRVALIDRVDHAIADGVAGVDVATVLLDADREVRPPHRVTWNPAAMPSPRALLRQSIADQAAVPMRLTAGAAAAVLRPRRLVNEVRGVAAAITGPHGVIAPRSSLNRRTGSDRSLTLIRQQLGTVKDAGAGADATVNDVVLSAVAGGLRALLLGRGEPLPPDLTLTILVPVSLRDDATGGSTLGNQVGGLFLPLPVGIGDPQTRLGAIAAISSDLKARREVTTSQLLLAAADLVPAALVGSLSELLAHQRFVNLVVTNVPGPQFPLYAMGAEMLEAFPIVPLAGNLTLGVAVLSYNGALNLGITADASACSDVRTFVAGVERSFAQLGVVSASSDELLVG